MAQLNNLLVTGDTRLLNRAHADIDGDSATVNSHTVDKDVPADAIFTDTTYTGTGLISVDETTHVISTTATSNTGTVTSITIKGTSPIVSSSSSAITTSGTRTISHATSGVTEGTYTSVTVNPTGHVTAGTNPTTLSGYGITDANISSGVITLGSDTITPLTSSSTLDATKLSGTIPSGCYTDTKNTAGSTDTSSKIFLIGATDQSANPQTYSQDTAYVGTDGHLYSNGSQVLNASQGYTKNTGTITGVSVNGTSVATSGVANITDVPASILSGAITNGVTATTQSAGDNSTKVATTAYVDNAIDNLPEPMVFKGSLGTGGTITTLPVDGSATVGDTYKVITAGTYASQSAKVGDTFICDSKTSTANTWILIPSGDEPSGTVTSITLKATSPIAIDSTAAITTSGTRTLSHATSGVTEGTYKSVTVNATGHITAGTNPTTIAGYGITDAKIASGTITLGSNTITPLTSSSTLDATKLSGTIPSTCYTDTKNTAGSTDTSSKIYLIGATEQSANPQTYSDNEVYATSGTLTTKDVQVGGGSATMRFNSTDNSIEFVFS